MQILANLILADLSGELCQESFPFEIPNGIELGKVKDILFAFAECRLKDFYIVLDVVSWECL